MREKERMKPHKPLLSKKIMQSSCRYLTLFLLAGAPLAASTQAAGKTASKSHGIAMHGSPKYPSDFTHFAYTNPNAPKGGTLNLGVQGTYRSLNPLNIKGGSAAGVRAYLYESLLARANDEPFSLYGLIAKQITVPDDRSSITFYLNKAAKFSDGAPITSEDVAFSHQLLKTHGRPNHRTYYAKVIKVERPDKHTITFTFDNSGDREMPLIMGLMPILPKHAMTEEKFKQTSLTPPIGSGPYTINKIDPGKQITYQRNPNYWGKDLPANRGRFNFDKLTFTYYQDSNALFEAFKKGLHDVTYEGNPGKWTTSYTFNAIKDGRVVKKEFPIKTPAGMTALVFNTRRPLFKDQNVRKALILLFNFQDINRKLFHNLYTRTESYFDRSFLAAKGKRADTHEQTLLPADFKTTHPELFDGTFKLPINKGKGLERNNIRKALRLLKKAGYTLKSGQLVHTTTNQPFQFNILTTSKAQESLLLNYIANLKVVGIAASIRQVDRNQFQQRKTSFDYDMFQNHWSGSLSPGNEQLFRWSSKQAETEASFNFAGIKDPYIDKAITALLAAKQPKNFHSSIRALDRLLLSGDYVLPLYHLKTQWLAHWTYLGHPDTASNYGTLLDTWWDKRSQK